MKQLHIECDLQKGDFRLDVDTQIPASGITGVFGASGAGKTTLLRCIAGLEGASGADARPVHERRIAYVFQTPQLFAHLSVRGNIEYGMRRAAEQTFSVEQVATMLGLQALLHRSCTNLSGGEAQRVAIARALCQSPRMILMDEPLTALDRGRREELLSYLDQVHRETTVPIVYVSHDIDEICRLCDHLVVLDSGRVVASGDLQSTLTRLDLPQLAGSLAGAVIDATTDRYDGEFDLTAFRISGGELWVPGEFSDDGVRLRIAANDVSVSLRKAESSSILNSLPAIIDAMEIEGRVTCLLRLKVGDEFLLARITRRSWQQLELDIAAPVFAQIKAVTVRR